MPPQQSQQYSDLPPGAVVMGASAAAYSDLPAGATVVNHGPEVSLRAAPPSGISHPINWLENAENDIKNGGESTWLGRAYKAIGGQPLTAGTSEETANFVGGPAVGPLKATRGFLRGSAATFNTDPDAKRRESIRAVNEMVSGAAQTAGPIVGVTNPEAIPMAVKYGVINQAVKKIADHYGADQETSEFLGNLTMLSSPLAQEGLTKLAASRTGQAGGAAFKAWAANVVPDAVDKLLPGGKAARTAAVESWKATTPSAQTPGTINVRVNPEPVGGPPTGPASTAAAPEPTGTPTQPAPVTQQPITPTGPETGVPAGERPWAGNTSATGRAMEADIGKQGKAAAREQRAGQIPDKPKWQQTAEFQAQQAAQKAYQDMIDQATKANAWQSLKEGPQTGPASAPKTTAPEDLTATLEESIRQAQTAKTLKATSAELSKPMTPRYAYRSRDVGETGVPSTSHSQATLNPDQAQGYLTARSDITGKPQELVRIDLNKLSPEDYQVLSDSPQPDWVKFSRDLPESAVEKVPAKSARKGPK